RLATLIPVLPPENRTQNLSIHFDLWTFLELVHENNEYSLMTPNTHVKQYIQALCSSLSAQMQ
ncbi:MAG: hypothetical protein ACKO7C_04585, partial [Bacteroidota bacterium]